MLIIVRGFLSTSYAGLATIFSYSYTLRGGFSQLMPFSYTVFATTTQKQLQVLSFVQTKTQEQGLTGYSSVRLTSRASHRLGKCRLSWVWLGFGLLSALSVCSACLGRGSHRHASSGFVSVQTDQTAQSWHDLVRTFVFLFTLIVLFWWGVSHTFLEMVLVRSFSYTPRFMLF